MYDDPRITERRIRRLHDERIRPAVWADGVPLEVTARDIGGEPVGFAEAVAGPFSAVAPGAAWGRPWDTTWFHMTATVPPEMAGERVEAVIDLGFTPMPPGFQAEAQVWSPRGVPLHGLHPLRRWHLVAPEARGGEAVDLYVEAASNPSFWGSNPSEFGLVETAPRIPLYSLRRAEIAPLREEVWRLDMEVEFVLRLLWQTPGDSYARHPLVAALGRAADRLDPQDVPATAGAARAELATVLGVRGAPDRHRIWGIGHAHIDTAWLWPVRETIRKCARTFSNQLELMDTYPEHLFGCSSAQHYAWMEERYPEVFAGIAARVGEGRWLPLGGMWVEADGNMPGGEALARQFLYGQRYFRSRFGVTCGEGWIPDVFGYPASLPQIMRLAGISSFVTQKMSWNRTNTFPHHTFTWEGLDGSTVLTHFPPAATYNGEFDPGELVPAVRDFADHGRSSHSLLPYGHGDGGGGPTREMLERARMAADTDGLPRLSIAPPSEFFEAIAAETPPPPVWRGELYLEMHRGTYTSQAATKAGNRRCEQLLAEAEWWWTTAATTRGAPYPGKHLERIWSEVLTLQFHDILPGSSIAWVHRETEADHSRLIAELEELIADALALLGDGEGGRRVANSAPFDRRGVEILPCRPEVRSGGGEGECGQVLAEGRWAVWVEAPAGGWGPAADLPAGVAPVVVGRSGMSNGMISLEWDEQGLITSFRDLRANREVFRAGEPGNVLELSDDLPVEYDAWDIESYYRAATRPVVEGARVTVLDSGPLVARVRVERGFSASRISQDLVVRAGSARVDVECSVDWAEREKMLKVAFPIDIRADSISCEIAYGHVQRPTHRNTSWDWARFEMCAHRWVDLSEPGFGVALLNDSKYGHDVLDGSLRLTLLRSPRFPDPDCDRGHHLFTYALFPHRGSLVEGGVVAEGGLLNRGVRSVSGVGPPSLARSQDAGFVIEALKPAEDGSGDLILRGYEAHGGRVSTVIDLGVDVESVTLCDLLEDPLPQGSEGERAARAGLRDPRTLEVEARPFRILTMRLARGDRVR